MKKRSPGWNICCITAIVLAILTFTPLVIPREVYHPKLLGLSYSFWAGILVTAGFVVLTLIGTLVHPGRREEDPS